ncbi:hypothetical protein PVAND_004951 [Polypedilum vanderplanki]|uniref:Uncharacterized protein n=1 Tax=Polypedilum vanderplanki TaxID=319348 RepID=A0A9J6BZM0_POLVA|nr:hypothetical protein PVAND_004951 [Polypedilum vanderplanki]
MLLLLLSVMGFCANSLGLKESNNGVITSTIEKRRDLRTELEAPLITSFSQYYQPPSLLDIELLKQKQNQQLQPQTLAQLLGLQNSQLTVQQQQQQSISPFLYLGPLISSDPGKSQNSNNEKIQQIKRRSDERSFQEQERDSYELYRNENDYYVDMMPPPEEQEPNYYVMKPRKFKKYNEVDLKKKKLNMRRAIAEDLQKEVFSTNKNNNHNDLLTESTTNDDVEQSGPASRLDFQMHGHRGPKSYKFGYDTGDGKNRQFRVEEKNEKGEVFGSYGYYDRKGKFRIVKYSSTIKDGFKIL